MNIHELEGKVIKFNRRVLEADCVDFSPNQRARVLGVRVEHDCTVLCLTLDFKDFEEANKKIAEHNYYDENEKPTLAWHETKFYPKNGITEIYADVERVEKNEDVFDVDQTYLWEAAEWKSPGCPGMTIRKIKEGYVIIHDSEDAVVWLMNKNRSWECAPLPYQAQTHAEYVERTTFATFEEVVAFATSVQEATSVKV
jgi:hypothetical protein